MIHASLFEIWAVPGSALVPPSHYLTSSPLIQSSVHSSHRLLPQRLFLSHPPFTFKNITLTDSSFLGIMAQSPSFASLQEIVLLIFGTCGSSLGFFLCVQILWILQPSPLQGVVLEANQTTQAPQELCCSVCGVSRRHCFHFLLPLLSASLTSPLLFYRSVKLLVTSSYSFCVFPWLFSWVAQRLSKYLLVD